MKLSDQVSRLDGHWEPIDDEDISLNVEEIYPETRVIRRSRDLPFRLTETKAIS